MDIIEGDLKKDLSNQGQPLQSSLNDELTIESMFQVYDKDAGAFMDVREIIDFEEGDFQNNERVKKILDYMN